MNDYLRISRKMIRELGLEEAVLLTELISEYEYYATKGKLENNSFFSTIENIRDSTGLSEYQQRKIINRLIEKKYISTELKGLPPLRYFTINFGNIRKELSCCLLNNSEKNKDLNSEKTKEKGLDTKDTNPEKLQTNNNNITTRNNNSLYISKEIVNKDISLLSKEELLSLKDKERYKTDVATLTKWTRVLVTSEPLREQLIKWIHSLVRRPTLEVYMDKIKNLTIKVSENEAVEVVKETIDKGHYTFNYSLDKYLENKKIKPKIRVEFATDEDDDGEEY